MALIPGKYQLYKNEDIDDFFSAVGVPYFVRKMIGYSSPLMEISLSDEIVTVKVNSKFSTSETKYTIGVEGEEKLPIGSIMSKTSVLNNHEMQTESISPVINLRHKRHYHFTKDGCTVTYSHEKSNVKGKRYYHRVE